jgi:hypothetical protein
MIVASSNGVFPTFLYKRVRQLKRQRAVTELQYHDYKLLSDSKVGYEWDKPV